MALQATTFNNLQWVSLDVKKVFLWQVPYYNLYIVWLSAKPITFSLD